MKTFAKNIIEFNKNLDYPGNLPEDIKIINPFKENTEALKISEQFYNKFYNDNNKRKFIIGINPGRFGGAITGIPFTDTKRLKDVCGIDISTTISHEPSSVFIYDMIKKYGGPEKFYGKYYINAIFPLALVIKNQKGNWVNCNYYDFPDLITLLKPFIISHLKKQISFGVETNEVIVLGKKNAEILGLINKEEKFFNSIVPLDHPRFIVQYKSKQMDKYVDLYLEKL